MGLWHERPHGMAETPDLFTRAAAIVDAYWSKHGWPSMQEAEAFHSALLDLQDTYGDDFDDAEYLVHDTATNLGWKIAMVDGRIERLTRPGTS